MSISPIQALGRLEIGNRSFASGNPPAGHGPEGRPVFQDLSAGQSPIAAVLGCSDSRVPVEMVFSQGPGDLFAIRVAGNLAGPHQIGSLEFAVGELGVPLILVLGHSGCRAVGAALDAVGKRGGPALPSHLGPLVRDISDTIGLPGDGRPVNPPIKLDQAVPLHVQGTCERLLSQSELLASRVRTGGLIVRGAVYDLRTGRVSFFGQDTRPPDG